MKNLSISQIKSFIFGKRDYFFIFLVISIFFAILQNVFPYFFLHDDNRAQYIAYYVSNYNSILRGEIPFFSFHQFAGMPHMSNGQSGVFFIPAYIAVFLSKAIFDHVFFTIDILSYFLIIASAFGTLRFLREIGVNDKAALIGSLIYPLNSFVLFVGNSWIVVTGTAAFFPWMMFLSLKLFHKPSLRNCLYLVICRVLFFTLGHMQYFIYSIVMELGFYIVLWITEGFSHSSPNVRKRLFSPNNKKAAFLLFSIIANVFLVMPLLLPGFERMVNSAGRASALYYEVFISGGTNIEAFISGLLRPFEFHGFLQFTSFVGRLTLVLCVICGIAVTAMVLRKKKNPFTKYLIAIFVMALFCFLWQTNIIAPVMYRIPIINRFRWHYKLQLLFFFYLTAFAAIGYSLSCVAIENLVKKRAKLIISLLAYLIIAIQTTEFIQVYAFTYDRPLSLRTWEDSPPFEEPLAYLLSGGRYISVGFDFGHMEVLHTLGYSLPQKYGLFSLAGYEMLLPANNYEPSLGLNKSGFYNQLSSGDYEISDLDHFRNWGVRYYVVNNEFIENFGPLSFGEVIFEDDKRTVFYDSEALQLVYRGSDVFEILDVSIGVNKIEINAPQIEEDEYFYFNFVYNDRFQAFVDGQRVEVSETFDNKIAVAVSAGTEHIELRYIESSFWLGLWIAAGFILVCTIVKLKYLDKVPMAPLLLDRPHVQHNLCIKAAPIVNENNQQIFNGKTNMRGDLKIDGDQLHFELDLKSQEETGFTTIIFCMSKQGSATG